MSQFNRTKTPGVSFKETRAGRSYYIDYVADNDTRRREKVEGGFEAAKDKLAEINQRRSHGEAVPGRVDITYAEYSEQVIALRLATGKIRPQSAKRYRGDNERYILPILGPKKLNKITKHDVLRVITTMQEKKYAGWTINGAITVMSMVLSEAQWALAVPNHVKSLKSEHRPDTTSKRRYHVLEPDEITALLARAATRSTGRFTALFLLALYSGLRQSELCGLWWEDLNLIGDIPSVRVHAQLGQDGTRLPYLKGKKEGESRVVEIPRDVARALAAWKLQSRYSAPTDYVFTARGTGFTQHAARDVFERCRDEAGIQADAPPEDRCTFHDMRDTFASMLIAGGADIVEVATAMGHTKKNGEPDPTTTLNYYAHEWKKLEKRGKLRDILEAASVV